MALRDRLQTELKNAMKAREADRLSALRLINAAIKQREVDERITMDDAQVMAALEKMLKQRRDSIAQYDSAGRDDLASIERGEVEIIQSYLPAQLSADEIATAIATAIAQTGAAGPQDMGKVIGALKAQIAGRADMGQVSALVKQALAR